MMLLSSVEWMSLVTIVGCFGAAMLSGRTRPRRPNAMRKARPDA